MRRVIGAVKLVKKPVKVWAAPHVKSGQTMRIKGTENGQRPSAIHGTAPKDKGYHDSNGRESARVRSIRSMSPESLADLEARAREWLGRATSVGGKQGLSRCKCPGRCGCPK